jgi:predicted nuclease with TOPRIM domain
MKRYNTETYADYQILRQKYDELLSDFTELEHRMSEGDSVFMRQRDRIIVLEADLDQSQTNFEQVCSEANKLEDELTSVLDGLSDAQDMIEDLGCKVEELKRLLTPTPYL